MRMIMHLAEISANNSIKTDYAVLYIVVAKSDKLYNVIDEHFAVSI